MCNERLAFFWVVEELPTLYICIMNVYEWSEQNHSLGLILLNDF